MSKKVRLFVEGHADEKFLRDYIHFLLPEGNPNDLDIIRVGGYTNLSISENKFKENSNDNGINLVIFDADYDFVKRKSEIINKKADIEIEFELFLFPNNGDNGELETLLCKIINKKNKLIFECFDQYQDCLQSNPNYHIPNLKSKIYAYLETLLPKKQQEQIKPLSDLFYKNKLINKNKIEQSLFWKKKGICKKYRNK